MGRILLYCNAGSTHDRGEVEEGGVGEGEGGVEGGEGEKEEKKFNEDSCNTQQKHSAPGMHPNILDAM